MSLFVCLFKFFKCVVCINLSCCKICMTKQFLYSIEVGTRIEHMRSKGMTQNMRTLPFNGCYQFKIRMNYAINKFRVELLPFIGKQKICIILAPCLKFLIPNLHVLLD